MAKKYSLRTKLSISYIFIAILLIAGISLLANFLLESQFKDYIIRQQKANSIDIVSLISRQYNALHNSWDQAVLENIGMNALGQGLIIKVKDASRKAIWDATVHNNGLCIQMINHMSQNMTSRYPNFKGKYVENSYPLQYDSKQVGTVDIGYYGPYYFNDNDLAFINTLNKMLLSVGLFSLVIALFFGAYMSRRLSTPISRVIGSARQIAKGNFNDRITDKSNTSEIEQLTGTINNLAETLEKQETLRKRLSADVAHELRTPLATLQSHMEAMIDGIWKPDVERIKSCHEEIIRINRMVGDMERLARFESENLILHKECFDVTDMIGHIVKNFEADFEKKCIELDLNGVSTKITADRDKISQVVVNLISNALKYTPEGGSVSISVNETAAHTEIIVKDTGMGIPPEDLPYIFERFYRADKSRNRMTGGSGIGLAIVKVIVEAHKGSVSVNSEPGVGSEFVVSLPKGEV